MAATVEYAKTRPIFDGYKAARYSKKYLAQHEAELSGYRAAKAALNELLAGEKLPKMADMKKARQELAGKKKALYAEYRKAQADMRQAVAVKANIDHLPCLPFRAIPLHGAKTEVLTLEPPFLWLFLILLLWLS
jgi:hypothetical protein